MTEITKTPVPQDERVTHTARLFGFHFSLHLEPLVYATADHLSADYQGGYWHFYRLSNGGFYMAAKADTAFQVVCENGFAGDMSADAFGLTACLYAYSRLSFSGMLIADACAQHYHWLRDYALDHEEAEAIIRATD
jgi:hypothetical protein